MEINGYRLGRRIAETEFCSVHNALDLATSKTVSVRIFNERLSRHPGFCNGFSRFARSLLQESIGVMVTLLQYEAAEDGCYAVTDYFPCLPLLQTQAVQMPPKALLQGGLEIAATLDLLRARDLVHGAVRPGNLFFNDQMKVTLGLGINRPEGEDARPLPIDGPAAAQYLPPEGGNGPESDYYALGISLHQLLFGRLPFDETDLTRQRQQKQQVLAELPDPRHAALLPLFQALLHPNTERRIQDHRAFRDAADGCGFRLMQPAFAASVTIDDEPAAVTGTPVEPEAEAEPDRSQAAAAPAPNRPVAEPARDGSASRRGIPWIAAGIGLLLVLLLGGWFLSSTPDKPATASAPASVETVGKPAVVEQPQPVQTAQTAPDSSPEPVVARPPDEIPQDEQLFLRARSLFAKGNPGSALISVNEALKINPRQQDALQLRKTILNELEIRSILKRAEEQLLAGRLSQPPGDNALESYRSLQPLLPRGDPRMQQGLSRVANRFLDRSRKALAQRKLDEAFQLADTGARLFPGFAPLQALREDLNRQRSERQRRLSEERKLQQIRKIEQARKLKRQQLQAQRKQSIEGFEKALAAGDLESSRKALEALRQLKTPDKQLKPLNQRLVQAYIDQSNRQIAAGDFSAANATLEQALKTGGETGPVQAQINRLQQAMEQQQKKQQVTRLLSEARVLINTGNAGPDDLQQASSLIHQAEAVNPGDPAIAAAREQLAATLERRSRSLIEAGSLDEADRMILIGQELSGDARWQALAQQARKARERLQRKSVPVIGTF